MKKRTLIQCTALVLFGILSTSFASAAEQNAWKSAFVFGAGIFGKTRHDVKVSALGTTVVLPSITDQASASPLFSGEVIYQPGILGGSLIVEETNFKYSNGSGSDGELGVFFMPRLAGHLAGVELWLGVGVGGMRTAIGAGSFSSSGGSATITNTPIGFAWTPRVGADISLGQRAFIGVEIGYVSSTATAHMSGDISGVSFTADDEFYRRWGMAALRVGTTF
jgi:hypothetical protein